MNYVKTYLGFEFIYYLYCRKSYNYMENMRLPNPNTKRVYQQMLDYFSKESNLQKYVVDSFYETNETHLTIEHIKHVIQYHVGAEYNIDSFIPLFRHLPFATLEKQPPLHNAHTMTSPLTFVHKPLIHFIGMKAIHYVYRLFLQKKGFVCSVHSDIIIWKYSHPTSTLKPVVFFHGFGLGIIPYTEFLLSLTKTRTVICPELPNISQNKYAHVTSLTDLTCAIQLYLRPLNDTYVVIGHSFGTIIMNIFQIAYPDLCASKIYMDPTCFIVHAPHCSKLRSMSCEQYVKHSNPLTMKQYLYLLFSYYYIFRDVYVQTITKRLMFMSYMTFENMDESTYVIVATHDNIISAPDVFNYISTHYPQVTIYKIRGGHGSCIYSKYMNRILENVDKCR